MSLKYCLSVMSQNLTKHYRPLQNKPVFWIIEEDTFTEIFTHSSSTLSSPGSSHVILQTASKTPNWFHFAVVATNDTHSSFEIPQEIGLKHCNTKETRARCLEENLIDTWQSLGPALVSNTKDSVS